MTLQPEVIRRFKTEVSILYKLCPHDQIPQILADSGENHECYLVFQFIEGNNLSQEISEGKCWSEAQTISFLQSALNVLSYIHQKGVIHCNIKPSNLIRKSDGKIVLIDFDSTQRGTEGYIPPEQRDGQPRICSDFYALGITAIQALTGKSPESLQRDAKTNELIWREGIKVKPELAKILNKMVSHNFQLRYQSATEVLKDLSDLGKRKISYIRLFSVLGVGVVVVALLVILIPRIFVAKGDQVFNEANELFNSGQYEKAAEAFDKVLKLNPNDYEALIRQGNAYIKIKEYTKSLNACEKAIQIKQNEAYAWNCKALALQNSQQYEVALEAHNTAIQLNPKSAVFWNNRGDTQLKLKQHDKALADFDNAILFDDKSDKDKSSVYLYNRGKALYESGKYEQAIASFDNAINLNPNYHYAWTGRGNALRLSGKYEESIAAYDRAIQIAPKDYESWYSKCLSLEKLDKIDEAIESCNQAIQIEPKNPAAIDAKQRLEKKLGR